MPLPNFLIIGAQKAGTSSLHTYLKQHPQVFMSQMKEPMFFVQYGARHSKDAPIQTLKQYQELFQGSGHKKAIGESSTLYLSCPWASGLIKEVLPDVRLIAILRNPIDRAWSHYLMHFSQKTFMFSENFSEAIHETYTYFREDESWEFSYLSQGLYFQQLERYYKIFPKEQIKVFLYDDFLQDNYHVIEEVFKFIEVDPSFKPDVSRRSKATLPVRNKQLQLFFENPSFLRQSLQRLLPSPLFQKIESRLKQWNRHQPILQEEVRQVMIEAFRDDVLALEAWLGRDLSHWLQ